MLRDEAILPQRDMVRAEAAPCVRPHILPISLLTASALLAEEAIVNYMLLPSCI